jgi:hypothetical protein
MAESETLQVQHAQGVHDGSCTGGRIEKVARKLRAGAPRRERLERVFGDLLVWRMAPVLDRAFGHQQFAWIECGEHGQEIHRMRVRGYSEFAGRKIEPCGTQDARFQRHGAQIVVARGVELVGGERGARAENADQGAADEFAGLRGLLLVADGNLPAGGKQLVHVGVERVIGDAGHRRILAFGQRQAKQPGTVRGVLMKHLEEVAQPE